MLFHCLNADCRAFGEEVAANHVMDTCDVCEEPISPVSLKTRMEVSVVKKEASVAKQKALEAKAEEVTDCGHGWENRKDCETCDFEDNLSKREYAGESYRDYDQELKDEQVMRRFQFR